MKPAPLARAALFAAGMLSAVPPSAESLPPNELGRVMILEYHKIDQPENRWTRTPENFRRDLQRLWERGYRLVALDDFLDGKIALPAWHHARDPHVRRLVARPVPLRRAAGRVGHRP